LAFGPFFIIFGYMKENSLFVEKYRSKTLDEYVGNEQLKQIVHQYLKNNDLQNLLLYGTPGTGKTTLAKLIVNNFDCDYLYINASDERGIDTIRDKVQGFASSASFKPIKIIILDEADFLTIQAQASLRNIIETYSRTTRFILTCNYLERIIDPLQSRCQVLKITPPSKKEVAQHISTILEQENINYKLEDLALVVNKHYPDIRKILNTCQVNNVDGVLKIDKTVLASNSYKDGVLKELKSPSKPSFKNIRQILADSNLDDFEEIYRFLYDNLDEYGNNDLAKAMIVIEIESYMYHANFRIDKEINVMALLASILKIINNK
jgi:DNA polymerase III delta prime subunit